MTAAPHLLGAHVSVAGGLHTAFARGAELRMTAIQVFTRNNTQWKIKPLTAQDVELWQVARAEHPAEVMCHDSYLINLASPDDALFAKSRASFLEEAERCAALEIPYLVFHPGSHLKSTEEAGLDRIADALNWVDAELGERRVTLLLENTAGQGTNLGWRFEHLRAVLDRVTTPERFGVCLDTCHLLAAGYDLRDDAGYAQVFAEFDAVVGLKHLRAFHLNDSKKGLGSRVDRHENIGKGEIGGRAFHLLMSDPRFRKLPMVLETPKADDMDRKNLALLRRYAGKPVAV